MIKNTKILITLSVLIFSLVSYGADKSESGILVVGSGAIIKGNLSEARKLAIADAI
jgi:hypothetical protein